MDRFAPTVSDSIFTTSTLFVRSVNAGVILLNQMAKRVRKKTKAELASPKFRDRSKHQAAVLMDAYHVCDKLSKKRHQFILDIADDHWMHRFENMDDYTAFNREMQAWVKLRSEFLRDAIKPLELHCFTCNWNAGRGLKPLLKIIKNKNCDAGTALRLYWINDPYYYQEYATIGECPYEEEREMLRILRAVERRFKAKDFATKRIPFDPTPWIEDCLLYTSPSPRD